MILNHDVTSLMGQRIMQKNSLAMKRSLEKLSTGMRTKIADLDNTSGLAISETMRSRIYGMEKALNNSQDGISLIQTASGALEQTQDSLRRMRELSVQASNDTLTQQDRSYIQVEINELRDEIDRIGNTTQFNRKRILSGDNAVLWSSTDKNVKAIINGGLRSIDSFGQKYAVDGNFKISVEAKAGKAEVQKTDIFKIKHQDTVINKNINGTTGIQDISVNNVPAGRYNFSLSDTDAQDPVITGSFGIGGSISTRETNITFQDLNSPVRKISVQTEDGITLWETSGADIFKAGDNNATSTDTQIAFFNGGEDDNGNTWSGVLNEIKTAAKHKGFTLDGDIENLSMSTINSGEAQGIRIIYDGGGLGNNPLSDVQASEATTIDPANVFTVSASSGLDDNASILFEVRDIDVVNGTVTLDAKADILSQDGQNSRVTLGNIKLIDGGEAVELDGLLGTDTLSINFDGIQYIEKGAKFVVNVSSQNPVDDAIGLNLTQTMDSEWPDKWDGGAFNGQTVNYILDGSKTGNRDINFRNFYVNANSGEVFEGDITLSTNNDFRNIDSGGKLDTDNEMFLAVFDAAYVSKNVKGDTKLRDIDKFWDSQGKFILDQPKELTLTQGDGIQAKITIYADDTMNTLASKLNDAIANGLGQAKYVDDATKFVSFVDGALVDNSESVAGTMIIRSALTGDRGKITLSGNEDVLKAFLLNTIQEAQESTYDITVRDAHTDAMIAEKVKVTGNKLVGVIHKNVDVEFDPMYGINAVWDEANKSYSLQSTEGSEFVLHLADNTTVFQTGASEGEDVMINIGDMRASALELDNINVMNRTTAARSTGIIDLAIDKVSMQMAKLGASQNRLEHHIGNLTDEMQALTEANSRIRDTDFAKEVLEYAKMQILMQSNTAMLAQANQAQQNILGLFR